MLKLSLEHQWIPNFLVLLDTADILKDLYTLQTIPVTIAIAQNGDIVKQWRGFWTGIELEMADSLKIWFGE